MWCLRLGFCEIQSTVVRVRDHEVEMEEEEEISQGTQRTIPEWEAMQMTVQCSV